MKRPQCLEPWIQSKIVRMRIQCLHHCGTILCPVSTPRSSPSCGLGHESQKYSTQLQQHNWERVWSSPPNDAHSMFTSLWLRMYLLAKRGVNNMSNLWLPGDLHSASTGKEVKRLQAANSFSVQESSPGSDRHAMLCSHKSGEINTLWSVFQICFDFSWIGNFTLNNHCWTKIHHIQAVMLIDKAGTCTIMYHCINDTDSTQSDLQSTCWSGDVLSALAYCNAIMLLAKEQSPFSGSVAAHQFLKMRHWL